MNKIAKYAFVISALVAPALSLAQPVNGPLTRAQVRADLVRLEQAGYNPARASDPNYPDDILAAEAKVAAEDAAASQQSGLGGVPGATTDSGNKSSDTSSSHSDDCVGPVSYCNIYFGGS